MKGISSVCIYQFWYPSLTGEVWPDRKQFCSSKSRIDEVNYDFLFVMTVDKIPLNLYRAFNVQFVLTENSLCLVIISPRKYSLRYLRIFENTSTNLVEVNAPTFPKTGKVTSRKLTLFLYDSHIWTNPFHELTF